MSLKGLLAALGEYRVFRDHLQEIGNPTRPARITVRQGARPAYLAALWHHRQLPMLVLTPRPEDSRRLYDQLLTYLGDAGPVYHMPESEVLPFERLAVDARTSNQRLSALAALASARSANPETQTGAAPLVIASVAAALRRTLSPSVMTAGPDEVRDSDILKVGQRIPRLESLLSRWVDLGYRHEPLVESPGSFSQRGGIIDVYPPHYELPFRIELWDDEVDAIRRFDPYTQRS